MYVEVLHRGFLQLYRLLAFSLIICIQVTCHAIVAGAISAVRGNIHLNEGIIFHAKILLGRHTDWGICWQYHDAVVATAYANLIFGTDHTE